MRVALCILCLAGGAISAQLVRERAGPWPGAERESSYFSRFCGEGADGQSGCAAALASDWSAFDVTVPTVTSQLNISRRRVVVPVAFAGLAYFVFLGVWHAFAGDPARWGRWYFVVLLIVAGSACSSVALIWILLFEIRATCTWCMITHALNGAVLLGVLALHPRLRTRSTAAAFAGPQDVDVRHTHGTIAPGAVFRIVGFAGLVVIGLWLYRGAKLETRNQVAKLLPYKTFVDARSADPTFLIREFRAEPEQTTLLEGYPGADRPSVDVPALTVFTGFQCPNCACFAHKWNAEYSRFWSGPVHVKVRHLPLAKECNESVTRDLHPEACAAGYAAEAARLQGGEEAFRKMHDLLFASTRHLDSETYERLADKIGLDGEKLVEDMSGRSVREAVVRDIALAHALGVHGTPTVFLNGRRVPDLCLYNPVFWEAISSELQEDAHTAGVIDEDAVSEKPAPGYPFAGSGVVKQ
jgi:protein-disulfide isomerase